MQTTPKKCWSKADQPLSETSTSGLGWDDKVNFYEVYAAKPVSKIAFSFLSLRAKNPADLKDKPNNCKTGLSNLET